MLSPVKKKRWRYPGHTQSQDRLPSEAEEDGPSQKPFCFHGVVGWWSVDQSSEWEMSGCPGTSFSALNTFFWYEVRHRCLLNDLLVITSVMKKAHGTLEELYSENFSREISWDWSFFWFVKLPSSKSWYCRTFNWISWQAVWHILLYLNWKMKASFHLPLCHGVMSHNDTTQWLRHQTKW